MSMELIAMLGGGMSGFIMKLIGALVEGQRAALETAIKKQQVADASADAAAKRTGDGGKWVRRFITLVVLFAVVVAPFLLAQTEYGVTVQRESTGLLSQAFSWLFNGSEWETLQGFVLLPEVRQSLLAILGFYFGSSQVR